MTPFDFIPIPKIIFGPGRLARLPEIAATLGRSPLLITNVSDARLLERIAPFTTAKYIQRGEPTVDDVENALAAARQRNADLVIALGGGSAIDCAKAVAALLANGGAPLDYMEVIGSARPITRRSIPFIAIPTTAGTGAEATRNAVIGSPQHKFKASIRSELMIAHAVIIDPELALHVRPEITARCGMDALCQLIESYTSRSAGPMTDPLALEGIKLIARSFGRAYEKGDDIDARSDMALAALFSGITLTNAGLGAAHGFAAPLGANYPVPHGTACAALLPPVIEANVAALREISPAHPVLARYANVGRTLAAQPALDDPAAIQACIEQTRSLCRQMRIPPLSDYGLKREEFPTLIAMARKASSMKFNPADLSDRAMNQILTAASG
jgi:alcohol dehydrogenase class IV